jgi:predicted nuclease of predicted toxin-antitoxin system
MRLARIFRLKTKLLLDECVTGRLESANKYNSFKINHSIEIIGIGAKDGEIRAYAKQTGDILVTRDFANCCRCLEQNIRTALYFNCNAYVIKVEKVIPLGEEKKTSGAPITKLPKLAVGQEWLKLIRKHNIERLRAVGVYAQVIDHNLNPATMPNNTSSRLGETARQTAKALSKSEVSK